MITKTNVLIYRKQWKRGDRRKRKKEIRKGKSETWTVVLEESVGTVTDQLVTPEDRGAVKDLDASLAPTPGHAVMKGKPSTNLHVLCE